MKNINCPRCESNSLDQTGKCEACGYCYKLLCSGCGHYNKMNSKFCGLCGHTLTLKVYWQQILNKLMPYNIRLRVRHFVTGLAFGTLLALFAFGALP